MDSDRKSVPGHHLRLKDFLVGKVFVNWRRYLSSRSQNQNGDSLTKLNEEISDLLRHFFNNS